MILLNSTKIDFNKKTIIKFAFYPALILLVLDFKSNLPLFHTLRFQNLSLQKILKTPIIIKIKKNF